MRNITFTENCSEYISQHPVSQETHTAYIPTVINKQDLFTKLSDALFFPDYFGRNWDALVDLYRDFLWIEKRNITIIHEDISKLPIDDLKTYVEIVHMTIATWAYFTEHPTFCLYYIEHHIEFVFNRCDEQRIMEIIEMLPQEYSNLFPEQSSL